MQIDFWKSIRLTRTGGGVSPVDAQLLQLSPDLTYSITHEYPNKVVEADTGKHRVIGQRGETYFYSIFAANLDSGDIKIAKEVKSKAVSMLVGGSRPAGISAKENVYNICLSLLSTYRTNENKDLLAYIVSHDIAGYGPISILLEDSENLEEIEINSPDSNIVVFHKKHGRCTTNLKFNGERNYRYVINRLIEDTEKELNSFSPIIDAHLKDGSRVHAQLKPYSIKGAAATIRLNNGKGIGIKRLIELGTASPELLAYLWLAVETGQNIIVAGAPAAGKTSLLMALNEFMSRRERIVTVEEDVNELRFNDNFLNVVPLQGSSLKSSANLKNQVINALHMRPERLIIGEIRGEEARDVFVGANLGVPFMTTVHTSANGQSVLNRLKARPMSVEPSTINMLDVSIFVRKNADSQRVIDSVVEYRWLSRDELQLDEAEAYGEVKICEIYSPAQPSLASAKDSKTIEAYMKKNLLSKPAALKELKKRAEFLTKLEPDASALSVHNYILSYGR